MALKNSMFTMKQIAEEINKNQERKISSETLKNKFYKYLQLLGIESSIFLSGNRDSREKRGNYIFLSCDAPKLMKEFFEILEKRNGCILFIEYERIVALLCEMIPIYKSEDEILLFKENDKGDNEEIVDIKEQIIDDMYKNQNKIAEVVRHYYGKQIGEYFFAEVLFIKTDKYWDKNCNKYDKKRHEFNKLQCEQVARWAQYWTNVFQELIKLKIVEKYSIFLEKRSTMKQKEWIDFCLGNDSKNNEGLKEIDKNKYMANKLLYNRIQIKENNEIIIPIQVYTIENTLEFCQMQIRDLMKWKDYLKDDFEDMIIEAFTDLENKYKILERYKALQMDIEKIKEQNKFIEDIGIEYFEIIEDCFESSVYKYTINK